MSSSALGGRRPNWPGRAANSAYVQALAQVERTFPFWPIERIRAVQRRRLRAIVAHAYDTIDMQRVYRAAIDGPADLRAFLTRLRDRGQPA